MQAITALHIEYIQGDLFECLKGIVSNNLNITFRLLEQTFTPEEIKDAVSRITGLSYSNGIFIYQDPT